MKAILLGISMALSFVSIVFICVSIAGLSFNEGVIKNVFWARANAPRPRLSNFDYINVDVDLNFKFGLRMVITDCDGPNDDDCGDGTTRFESCYMNDDKNEDSCFSCKDSGRAAGALCVFALVCILAALGVSGARMGSDSDAIKYTSMGLHAAVCLLCTIALVIWGAQCYKQLRDDFLSTVVIPADFYGYYYSAGFDTNHIKWFLGPGSIVLIVTCCLQPVHMALLFFAPTDADAESSNNDSGTKKEAVPGDEL